MMNAVPDVSVIMHISREALEEGEDDGAVAGVLGDLLVALLALLLQGLDRGDHHREQLHDDRRADVGHDAQREDRELLECTSGEDVEERERSTREPREGVADDVGIDARRRYLGTHAVDREHPEGEEDPAL
jgi:hypothetical protein